MGASTRVLVATIKASETGRVLATSGTGIFATGGWGSLQTTEKEEMSDNRFPPGWNEERVDRLLEHYEGQSDEEAVAEDEATLADAGFAVMKVPHELVTQVRGLIAAHKVAKTG